MTTPVSPSSSGPLASEPTVVPGANTSEAAIVRDLATALAPPVDTFDTATLRKGEVLAVSYELGAANITATLSGDTTPITNIACISTYSPHVGDVAIFAKQGNGLIAMGSVASNGGWTTVTLLSGFSHNGNNQGPVQYRLVQDRGSVTVQWRGGAAISGSPSTVCIVPEEARPEYIRTCLAARDVGGGSNVVKLDFWRGGNVELIGGTTNELSMAHDHYVDILDNGHNHSFSGSGTIGLTAVTIQGYTNDRTHSHPVNFPNWISFNGVQYCL